MMEPPPVPQKTDLGLMTWEEARVACATNPVVFVTFGSLEQNGPQNPLGLDSVIAGAFAAEVAQRVGGVSLPVVPFGNSQAFSGFPGTIWLRPHTLFLAVRDILSAVASHGFTKIVVINGHGPNAAIIEHAVRELDLHNRVRLAILWPGQIAHHVAERLGTIPRDEMGHGGEPSTSLMLALAHDAVRMDLATSDRPHSIFGVKVANSFSAQFADETVGLLTDTHLVNPSGVTGSGEHASAERGNAIFAEVVDWGVKFVDAFYA